MSALHRGLAHLALPKKFEQLDRDGKPEEPSGDEKPGKPDDSTLRSTSRSLLSVEHHSRIRPGIKIWAQRLEPERRGCPRSIRLGHGAFRCLRTATFEEPNKAR
jgi:hypothetical protein